MVIAIIPARGGSKGIPDKNLQEVFGISLLQRSIQIAKAVTDIVEVFVDTDSPEIAERGRSYGASVPFLRDSKLAQDDSQILDSLINFFQKTEVREKYQSINNIPIVLLQPTSPLRKVEDILECLSVWRENQGRFSVATVSEPLQSPKDIIRFKSQGDWEPILPDSLNSTNRQNFGQFKFITGSVYIFSLKFISNYKTLISPQLTKFVEVSQEASIDIDTPFDLLLANKLCN